MTRRFLLCLFIFIFWLDAHAQSQVSQSWADVKAHGGGTMVVYWSESRPFIYADRQGRLMGIESEILAGFQNYLKKNYHIDLQIKWKEGNFKDTYATIRDGKQPGSLGASAFSITPERQREVDFSSPYMSDISVMISSKNIPVMQASEFTAVFSKLTAITIAATTYEQDLLNLKEHEKMPFKIKYIPSSQNILREVEKTDSTFGYIDLPVYLMIFNDDPSIHVRRQNLFPVRRDGFAFIYPKSSDWAGALDEYFYDENFKTDLDKIISKYIDAELYHFIEGLAIQSNDPVALLTKEKEIQDRGLLGQARQIAEDTRARYFLIAFAALTLFFVAVIYSLYQKRSQQKKEIEAQGRNIALKSLELEKRNQHLLALDEEKNNLIKILAHDLRTPINHVQGLAQIFLLTNKTLPEEQKNIILDIVDASVRQNKMISNLLDIDAIENNRVKIQINTVPITSLVSQVVRSFERTALKKNISLSFSATHEAAAVHADPLYLIQVFENLLSNAIKFSDRGKSVEITVCECAEKVTIAVKDHGPGLTEEDRALLFKKFQKLTARPTAGESSTGLGLSIVKKYVELMGGKVWCESQFGEGTTFKVAFDSVKETQVIV